MNRLSQGYLSRSTVTMLLLLIGFSGCLYSDAIPTPPLVPEDLPPIVMNANPPHFARVILTGEGQLFEVWLKDPNIVDRDSITIDWQLEQVQGLRGTGTKLFLLPEELPDVSDNFITLEAIAQDGSGKQTKVTWYLSKNIGMETIE